MPATEEQLINILNKANISPRLGDGIFRIPGTLNDTVYFKPCIYGNKEYNNNISPNERRIAAHLYYVPNTPKKLGIAQRVGAPKEMKHNKKMIWGDWQFVPSKKEERIDTSDVIVFDETFKENIYAFISSRLNTLFTHQLIDRYPVPETISLFMEALVWFFDKQFNTDYFSSYSCRVLR